MSLSLPSRYTFFSGSTPLRITRNSNLCFATTVAAVRTSRRDSKLFLAQPILLRQFISPRIVHDYRANASSIESYEDATNSDEGFDLESLISLAEVVCILSSAVISVILAVNYAVIGDIGKKFLSLGFVVGLVGSVAYNSWFRRRQWMRICKGSTMRGGGGGERIDLIRRFEKLDHHC